MYDICHPVYYNMTQFNCHDQIKVGTAFYVYMELCEVKRLWDVQYYYNAELQMIYLTAKKCRSSESEIYVPWPAIRDISIDEIERIQQHLNTTQLILVFKEGDSSSVYYKVSAGLVKPLPPDESKLIKQKEERRQQLEREIKRNNFNLFELAKSTIKIEDKERAHKTEKNENLKQ